VKDVLELAPIQLNGRGPVEAVEGDAVLEAGLVQVPFQGLLVPPLHLVGQQQRQERGVIQLLRACQRQPLRRRGHQRAKLQAFEQAHQIGVDGHDGVSRGSTKR